MSNPIDKITAGNDVAITARTRQLMDKAQRSGDIEEAGEAFESLFVLYMLKSMRQTIQKSGLLGDGLGGDIYESMFDQELASLIADRHSLGVSELFSGAASQFSDHRRAGHATGAGQIVTGAQSVKTAISTYNRQSSPSFDRLEPFEAHIKSAAKSNKLDTQLIRAVIVAESNGDANAVSAAGAKGLMQLMDSTAKDLGVENSFNPQQNINGGSAYLSQLIQRFDGDLSLALAAYNAGPAAVEKYGSIPPYKETRNYVKKVLQLYKKQHP